MFASVLSRKEPTVMLHIDIPEQDALLLRQMLSEKLKELRREESHTDSPRYRSTLYDVDGALERLIGQLERAQPDASAITTP
jgi:hypothetical protein